MVHQDAQKTNAYQSSKAVLLSETATIHTKPQLEIFADDVKCSHGAAIGQMNKNEIFYFMARGIDEKKAAAILNYAFVVELYERISDEKLKAYLIEKLKKESDIDF
jgi:Fe-S cluster assembly protein SufD